MQYLNIYLTSGTCQVTVDCANNALDISIFFFFFFIILEIGRLLTLISNFYESYSYGDQTYIFSYCSMTKSLKLFLLYFKFDYSYELFFNPELSQLSCRSLTITLSHSDQLELPSPTFTFELCVLTVVKSLRYFLFWDLRFIGVEQSLSFQSDLLKDYLQLRADDRSVCNLCLDILVFYFLFYISMLEQFQMRQSRNLVKVTDRDSEAFRIGVSAMNLQSLIDDLQVYYDIIYTQIDSIGNFSEIMIANWTKIQQQAKNIYYLFLILNQSAQQNYKQQKQMKDDSALKLLLQKQITNEQYKIIDDYKKTAQNLQKEQSQKKQNNLKLQELQRKISCLEFMNTTSARESMRYQRKLDKLQNTQNYATQLLRLKYKSYVEQEQEHSARKQDCINKRDAMEMNRKLSKSVYDRRKRERIERIKEDQQKTQLQYRRMSGIIEAQNKQKKQKIRQQQLRMKDRMKRYQVFKLQRAALNYNQKIQSQFNLLKQRSRYLQDLKSKAKNEQIIFRKSQILNRQTAKIQSIYLTGADL